MKKIIIIILAVAYVLGQIARVQQGNIAFTLLDLGVGAVSTVYFFWHFLIKRKISFTTIEKLFIGFLVSGVIGLLLFIPSLTLPQIGTALLYPVRLLAYVLLFYQVRYLREGDRKFVIWTLSIVGLLLVIFGLGQFLFYPALKNLYYLGWDDHLYRLFSTFLDPNFAGAFFVTFALFAFELILQAKKTSLRIILAIVTFSSILCVFLTYSRTGFIMLIFGFGVFLLSYAGKKVTSIALALCIILFLVVTHSKLEGHNLLRTASSEARVGSAYNALTIIAKYPLFGVGYDAYRYAQVKMGYTVENPRFPSHADAGTDNSYLFVLATTGLVGFIFFVLFWVKAMVQVKKWAKEGLFPARSLFAGLCAVFVGSLFLNILFYPMIVGWLAIQAGLIQSKKR